MTLSQTIHDVWKSNRLLCNRIPVEFLTYNFNPYERIPRAAFTIKNQNVAARTNQGVAAEKAIVEFIILETSFAYALSDLNQIIESYDGKTFELVTNVQTVCFAVANSNVAYDNGHWKAVVNFDVSVFRY
ncbi:MAG: hypothetical protein IKX40_01890 [Thermoguttaceae bacterium]|nr:hypothetical protein [Thermoguttaceae bacterium]